MAKSKQQKRQEAMERKRRHLQLYRVEFLSTQWPSVSYQQVHDLEGRAEADAIALRTKQAFEKACKEAGVDTHGNLL